MKANIFFEIAEDGCERAVAQLMTDDGEPLGELPCIRDCIVSKRHGEATEITIKLVVDRRKVTLGKPRTDGQKEAKQA